MSIPVKLSFNQDQEQEEHRDICVLINQLKF